MMRGRSRMTSPPLSTLDLVCLLMDSPERPLDFALLLDFDSDLGEDALRRGARSARNLYAQTGCRVADGCWSALEPAACESAFRAHQRTDSAAGVERFLKTPFLPETEPPLRQLWISDAQTGGGSLITRIHHCAADLISGLEWIRHQLRVAAGLEEGCTEPASVTAPALAEPPPGAKRNPGWARCEPLWTRSGEPSGDRSWTTFSLDSGPLLRLSRAELSDSRLTTSLAVAALETLHHWNRAHGEGGRKVGIWLPVNIRQDPLRGFGNASSRIRVRRDFPDHVSLGRTSAEPSGPRLTWPASAVSGSCLSGPSCPDFQRESAFRLFAATWIGLGLTWAPPLSATYNDGRGTATPCLMD